MIWTNLDFLAVVAYGLVFFGLIFRAEMFQWFWASVVLWLGVSILGSQLLPGMWGITHVGPLFVPHFYLTFASVFFFAFHWKKQADTDFWQADLRHPFFECVCCQQCVDDFGFCVDYRYIVFYVAGPFFGFYVASSVEIVRAQTCYWFILQFVIMTVFLSAPQKHCQAVAGGVQ